MRVVSLSEAQPRTRRVAVGEFDGVHLGHRAVIEGSDTVLTFEPHPASVVRPGGGPKLLTTLELKSELVAGLGVDELVVVPFDERVAHQEASEFVDNVLVRTLGATRVSVGENFRFGHRARGTASLLAADGRFETRVVPLVEVVAGDQRGRELGFPTANLVPDPNLTCPGHGVYACRVGEHLAAVNVGVRPTFGSGLKLLVEAFLLDFQGDLYGERLTIEFIERLRSEQRFDSVEDLVAQMHRDVETTRELLASGVE